MGWFSFLGDDGYEDDDVDLIAEGWDDVGDSVDDWDEDDGGLSR